MSRPITPRQAIPVEYTWDIDSIFPSPAAWEAEATALETTLTDLRRFRGTLGTSPETLADWLDAASDALQRVGKLYVYTSMAHNVDTTDQGATALHDRAMGLYARAAAATAFAEPELLTLDPETLKAWVAAEPRLADMGHYFDTLERRRVHIRSAEVEELLGQLQDPFRTAASVHGVLADADLPFAPARGADGTTHEVTQGTINALLTSPDREVRRSAFESYADAHLGKKNTMATSLAAGVKQQVFMARARRYPSALAAATGASFIPVEVFYSLIETFRRHLPTWHRYWRLRREALGYDQLHVYDIKAPLTAQPPQISWDAAVEWIAEGMRPLGDEYVEAMRRGVNQERWVDIYPNLGKRAGAYSSGVKGTHPFILMSYHDDIFGLSTLAHELGHSMHSFYTRREQPFIYSRYSLFVAEVASNFNQALVRAHLLATQPHPDFQIAVIEEAMANFHRYFFIMPTLARFELEIHERVERGQPLNAEGLMGLMTDLFHEGYGDEVVIDADRIGITWAQFPTHLYANFYVYQYATGISGAHALAQRILDGDQQAVDNYLAFLKAGASLYPLDALRLAGVDLASPEPVEQTFGVLSGLVDRLETLVGQRAAR